MKIKTRRFVRYSTAKSRLPHYHQVPSHLAGIEPDMEEGDTVSYLIDFGFEGDKVIEYEAHHIKGTTITLSHDTSEIAYRHIDMDFDELHKILS